VTTAIFVAINVTTTTTTIIIIIIIIQHEGTDSGGRERQLPEGIRLYALKHLFLSSKLKCLFYTASTYSYIEFYRLLSTVG